LASPAKELKQFQRGVLNMMQLHPQANVLAECVFERMPLEGFADAKKVLLPDSGGRYDSMLSHGSCKFILNKYEKEEELLRPIRQEYERVNGTLFALSDVCEILNGLHELKKMRDDLGEEGGAGHFWGNDRWSGRDEMFEEEIKKVLGLLGAGEKKINLKEEGVSNFFQVQLNKNGKKLKNSFGGKASGRSPRVDGQFSLKVLIIDMEEMNISISG